MIKWTKELVTAEALKFKTRIDFKKQSGSAYTAAYRRFGIMDEICAHMDKPAPKWTNEMIWDEALKYERKTDFIKGSPNAYDTAHAREILDTVCSHMVEMFKWTDELLQAEAYKYDTKIDLINGSPNAYSAAHKRGILDHICLHMKEPNSVHIPRLVYVYEFSDKSAYIGLTWNIDIRDAARKIYDKDPVTKHKLLTGIEPEIKILSELVSALYASELEKEWVKRYTANGWNILNKAKAGNLGGYSRNGMGRRRKRAEHVAL
jgi:hypothetical protein